MADLFAAASMYDGDYLYFFATPHDRSVSGYGEDGRPLTADHKRMVIVADLFIRAAQALMP